MIVEFKNLIENSVHQNVQDVSPEEVLKNRDNLLIIDVRHPEEFTGELGHIHDSVLLELDNLPREIDRLPKKETIVFICRSGNRSGQAAMFAKEHGFKHVYNMNGGMLLWNEKNYATDY